jgi:hypothetical protein
MFVKICFHDCCCWPCFYNDCHGGRPGSEGRWVGTWTASPQQASSPLQINGQTLRQIPHTSIGGDRVRVRLSNVYGANDLRIGSAHVAISGGGAAILLGAVVCIPVPAYSAV